MSNVIQTYPTESPGIPAQLMAGEETNNGNVPFAGLAKSHAPIETYSGRIYLDFSGMRFNSPIAIDYCHGESVDETLGFVDRVEVTAEGLRVFGELTPLAEGDLTDQLIKKSRKGVPYQMSIDFRGPMTIETVSSNATATVNGQVVNGPCEIVRQWSLTRVAICLTGVDRNTSAQLTAEQSAGLITFLPPKENPMPIETVAQLREAHPDLCTQLLAESKAQLSVEVTAASEARVAAATAAGATQERQRVSGILALCATANLPDQAQQLIESGVTIEQARAALFQQLAQRNKAPGMQFDNTLEPADPEAQFAAEYDANQEWLTRNGITKEEYVKTAKLNK